MSPPKVVRSSFQSSPERPFPTRGVSGGWRDPWDADPRDALLPGSSSQRRQRRVVAEEGQDVELVADIRADGRWDGHVVSWQAPPPSRRRRGTTDRPETIWPSVNGPTAAVTLDALEAEVLALVRATLSE